MIELIIDNSYSTIKGLSIGQHKELRSVLSYYTAPPNSYMAKQYGVKKVSLLSKHGVFPTGLLLNVTQYVTDLNLFPVIKDLRIAPINRLQTINGNIGVTPYPEQVNAVKACIRQNRGIVSAVTGFGKSVTMMLLVNTFKLRTLIVVPNLELKRQLTSSFEACFPDMSNITIENIDSKKLNKLTDYDCLIIDEAHHVAAATYRQLNKTAWKGIYHRYFFTATPYRSIKEEQMLFESIAGQVIYEVDHTTAVRKGYIVPLEAYYLDVPKTKVTGSNWSTVYQALVVNNEPRNALIAQLLTTLKAEKKSTLCLVKEIKHGDKLSHACQIHFANGQDEDSKDMIKFFSQGKLNSLIGTTGVLSEGVDTKPAEYIIIAGLGKAKNSFMQSCGRGFRNWPGKTSCKIIIFRDTSHRFSIDHFKNQLKFLRDEFGIEAERIEL